MYNRNSVGIIVILLSSIVILYNIGSVILGPGSRYFDRYYTEDYFKRLEYLYNNSQYRQKNPTSVIPDEIVFRYAAGTYVRGVDPILVNSEHTPLGKYFIGLSYVWFQSDAQVILLFAVLTLVGVWLLSKLVLKSNVWSLLSLAVFSSERLFLNQLRITPLLDIIQLPFILFSLYAFLREEQRERFFWTSLMLGFAAATKTVVPAVLLGICFSLFFLFKKRTIALFRFTFWLPMSLLILLVSYTRTFLDGYTFGDFLKFQKWIFLYQQSKLIFPLSFWQLAILNRWQTWWGDTRVAKANDWSALWPIAVLMPFITLLFFKMKRLFMDDEIKLLLLWGLLYETFLSLGITATRFLLPLLPILYILLFSVLQKLLARGKMPL